MSIRFGQWELRPDKSGNWALWAYREATKGNKAGEKDWIPCYRYFQWNTIGNALIYAANEELMERNVNDALVFQEYADELRKMLEGFSKEIKDAIKESQ